MTAPRIFLVMGVAGAGKTTLGEALAARLAARRGHYFPAGLLDSQLATLEPPGDDERCVRLAGEMPTEAAVAAVESAA